VKLVCEECRHGSRDGARGWRGYLIAAGDEEDGDTVQVVVFFCPCCAEREFGGLSTASKRQPGW